jgi:hypothetical protein
MPYRSNSTIETTGSVAEARRGWPGAPKMQTTLWNPQLQQQYINIRNDIVNNYDSNMSVINTRWVAAALDYNGAKGEIENSKNNIESLTHRLASESDKLNDYLRRVNEENNGPKIIQAVAEKELVLRKLEAVNTKVKNTKKLRSEQAKSLYNKYEGNYHDTVYPYAPWEVESSRWFSWSPLASYMNINPAARSGLLFLGFFFGFVAIIALGAKASSLYFNPNGVKTSFFSGSTSTKPSFFSSSPAVAAPRRF